MIVAKTSGEVTSLYDSTETVSSFLDDVNAVKLSNSPTGEDDSEYVNFAVLVTKVDTDELQVKMSANSIGDIDLTMVDSIGSAICTNAGTVQKSQIGFVYGYNGSEWIEQNVNAIQSGEITFDAISANSYEGTVKAIDTIGENNGGNTKYSITVTLKREENMLSGMNTHITFSFDKKEKVKVIPESALYEEADKVYVYTGYDNKKDELTGKKEVTTGLADGENVEILSGLDENDTVYYRYADSLTISPVVR